MLSPISGYSVAQKSLPIQLRSLPTEIQEEVEDYLDLHDRKSYYQALMTATRNGEPIDDSLALKLHLLLRNIPHEYQSILAQSDADLGHFAWSQLDNLRKSGQLDQIIEKPTFFKLLLLLQNSEIFEFLKERIEQEPELEKKLLNWVERSKQEEVESKAANALTLLVKSGVLLNDKDFNRIRVRGADLSYGVFDYTEFKDADLREVNLHHAWLREANLNNADLAGVEFGERRTLEVAGAVQACCYSPEGRWLAIAERNTIQLYDAKNLQWTHTYLGHAGEVESVTFSPNGKWLASGGDDHTIRLWSVSGARLLMDTYLGHEGRVHSVAFSPDGQWLASGSADHTVKLWNLLDTQPLPLIYTYTGHEDMVRSVAFSCDGQWLASGSSDKTIKLWDVSGTRSLIHTYENEIQHELDDQSSLHGMFDGSVWSIAFSYDGKWLASSHMGGEVKLWNVSGSRTLAYTYAKSAHITLSVAFSRDGRWLAFDGSDHGERSVELWRVSGAETPEHTYKGHRHDVNSLMFSPDSRWLMSGSGDHTVRFWSISGARPPARVYRADESPSIGNLAFSYDGQWLAYGASNNTVKLWKISGIRSLVHTYEGHKHWVSSVAFSRDGQLLASCGWDCTVMLWSVSDPKELVYTYGGHEEAVCSVAFSSDGQRLVSGSLDERVDRRMIIWNISGDRTRAKAYTEPEGGVLSAEFSNDGEWFAFCAGDTVKLWNLSGNDSLGHRYEGHQDMVSSVTFSPDSRWLASGSYDCTIKLWGVLDTRPLVRTYIGHEGKIDSVAFSPDGQWLASGSEDHTVRLWSVYSDACQKILTCFVQSVTSIVWRNSPDGLAMLATSELCNIHLWRVYYNSSQIIRVRLEWALKQDNLIATGALIETARNLTPDNRALLRQRGASQAEIIQSLP
ncbi:NTPase-like protein [Mycoavidus cysteinexigens]|uniref:NTPase-like protein n=1 Tax=Mycoavidus cysteinexigens TaxID=1553431 RepID=A0A2Z6ETU7_9BURK|nr:pentapeptide repeat-containing protein [Mycoavidus cysteinexigens]BBE08808.1 NTPase-like protein [Mycoavidus cysteinexigens]GAM52478.1 hypothetical protein EBME_0941 [bacterium endosymbiont of Mortierella elongata FMR23-6]GLR02358.1 hypothetical protein GCM10007934_21750 [Mycoavidus cysteinexigens]